MCWAPWGFSGIADFATHRHCLNQGSMCDTIEAASTSESYWCNAVTLNCFQKLKNRSTLTSLGGLNGRQTACWWPISVFSSSQHAALCLMYFFYKFYSGLIFSLRLLKAFIFFKVNIRAKKVVNPGGLYTILFELNNGMCAIMCVIMWHDCTWLGQG